jgi:hypothetical protein
VAHAAAQPRPFLIFIFVDPETFEVVEIEMAAKEI